MSVKYTKFRTKCPERLIMYKFEGLELPFHTYKGTITDIQEYICEKISWKGECSEDCENCILEYDNSKVFAVYLFKLVYLGWEQTNETCIKKED